MDRDRRFPCPFDRHCGFTARRRQGMHSLVRRIPMALDPLIGGVFIGVWGETSGVRLAFWGALVMAAVALLLQQHMIEDDTITATSSAGTIELTPEKNPLKLLRLMNPAMKGLLITDILIRFCEQILYAFMVVWCMKVISAPVSTVQFGVPTSVAFAALGGAFLWQISPQTNLITAFGFGVIGTIGFAVSGRDQPLSNSTQDTK